MEIILHSISLIALVAVIIYVVCFFFRYRIIPQSLSVTAEWTGRYRWWQTTMCTVMGWLSYYFPTIYSIKENGLWPILASCGIAGLALAGYFSYSPGEETKRDLMIHKIGSFAGAVMLCCFYLFALGWWQILIVLSGCLGLGLLIKGNRYGYPKDHSIIFWEELGIIGIIGYDIITKFIQLI